MPDNRFRIAQDLSGIRVAELSHSDQVSLRERNSCDQQRLRIDKRCLDPVIVDHQFARLCKILSVQIISPLRDLLDRVQCDHSHTHCHDLRGERIRLPIDILLPVQYIILQCLQVILIELFVFHFPMEIIYRTVMNADPAEKIRHRLIGREIMILLMLEPQIIPHKVTRLICRALFEIRIGKSHRRKMISVEHNNGRLASLIHILNEILHKGIHLMRGIDIIFPLTVLLRCGSAGHLNGGILDHVLCGISPMSLNRDDEDKILILSGIQSISDMRNECFITHPADLIDILLLAHVLAGREIIEAQVRIDRLSRIERRVIIVDRMGGISEIPQDIRCGLTGPFLEHALKRILSCAEIAQRHPCQRLKFRIDRPGSYRRDRIETGRIFFGEGVPVRVRILRELQPLNIGGVKERFELDDDDIRELGKLCSLRLSGFLKNIFDQPGRVIFRFIDPRIQDRNAQAIRKSVILIRKGNITKIRRQLPCLEQISRQPEKSYACQEKTRDDQFKISLSPIARCPDRQDDQDKDRNDKPRNDQDLNRQGNILGKNTHRLADRRHVRTGERRHAVRENDPVRDAQSEPDRKDQTAIKESPPQKEHRKCRYKNQQSIIQEHLRPVIYEGHSLPERPARHPLYAETQKNAHNEMKGNRKSVAEIDRLLFPGAQLFILIPLYFFQETPNLSEEAPESLPRITHSMNLLPLCADSGRSILSVRHHPVTCIS